LTGINKSHFSDLKSGRIKNLSWTNMVKLADALDISLDEFR
ncbi:helix-turn-helix transcriptional regulator, partial [Streptococcus agalactiae]|nr:helix-turn-helix transcriptional regulator [Streptococcus agalactiae]